MGGPASSFTDRHTIWVESSTEVVFQHAVGLRLRPTVRQGRVHLAYPRDPAQPVRQREQIVVPAALDKDQLRVFSSSSAVEPSREEFDLPVCVKNLCVDSPNKRPPNSLKIFAKPLTPDAIRSRVYQWQLS
jgi:hypothetical protein